MNDDIWLLWLSRANSNLKRAELDRQLPDILYEDLCFDTQQAVEKSLKGLMSYLGINIPKTHSISYLLQLIEKNGTIRIPRDLNEASILTDYAVTTRYPGDWEPVSAEEYTQAVYLAQKVYQWVSSIVLKP
ncbi:HEPN domain-containing protein [Paradesulfitobacterium aromaticivorans]